MIETGVCDRVFLDMMNGVHQPDDDYRMALYSDDAELGPRTREYTTDCEVEGFGYDSGGVTLYGRRAVLVNGVACLAFDDAMWPKCSIAAAGCLVYNASRADAAMFVVGFGETKFPYNGEFVVEFPLPTPRSAALAIGRSEQIEEVAPRAL